MPTTAKRNAYRKQYFEAMPPCSWSEGCKKKVENVGSQLCNNHYAQTPKGRDVILKKKYGLDPGEFENLMSMQQGKCGICQQPESIGAYGKAARLCVDHCHDTGAVRGLLCHKCNAALGKFNDDPLLLQRAVLWLTMDELPDEKLVFF